MTYLNINEVDTAVVNLAQQYPATSQLITLPQHTVDGRVCHALQIGAGLPGTRDTVVLIGGIHAREWGSCEILVNVASRLLAAYQANTGILYGNKTFTAQEVRTLLETLHLVVFPLVNPDGRHHSQTQDANWRKNRRVSPCGHEAHRGVDINRNFDFLFDFATAFHPDSGVSVTADACDDDETDVYQGVAAFSEPETRNVEHLLNGYTRTRWYVDVHSYGETIMYSWGDDENQSALAQMNFTNAAYDGLRGVANDPSYGEYISGNDLLTVQGLAGAFRTALQAVRGTNYTAKPSFELYPTCGASDDYAFSRHTANNLHGKAYAFTVEFGQEFAPAWAEMAHIVLDVSAGLTGLCLAAAAAAVPVVAQGGPPVQDNAGVV